MQRVLVPAFSAVGGSAPARPRHAPLLAHPLPAPLNRPAGGRRPQCRPPPASSALGSTVEEDPSSEQCVPPDIVVDNKGAQWTQLTIEARDYPGLRRVVAWILNGMGMRVVSANLRALPGGRIRDTFTVSDLGGRKLRDGAAELLAERLGDFVQRCSPPELSRKDTEFASGPISVSNSAHPDLTVLTVRGEPPGKAGFMLELTNIISSTGHTIREGDILSAADPAAVPESASHDFSRGRLFRFALADKKGRKLGVVGIAALLFALETAMGRGYMPTKPPTVQQFCAGGRADCE